MKTAKMREQEAHQKAARLGPVPIRVQLPNGLTLQVQVFGLMPAHSHVSSNCIACLGPVPIQMQLPNGLTLQVKPLAYQVACLLLHRNTTYHQKAARLGPLPIPVQLPSGLTLQIMHGASARDI